MLQVDNYVVAYRTQLVRLPHTSLLKTCEDNDTAGTLLHSRERVQIYHTSSIAVRALSLLVESTLVFFCVKSHWAVRRRAYGVAGWSLSCDPHRGILRDTRSVQK